MRIPGSLVYTLLYLFVCFVNLFYYFIRLFYLVIHVLRFFFRRAAIGDRGHILANSFLTGRGISADEVPNHCIVWFL